jgi:hypothetical protein
MKTKLVEGRICTRKHRVNKARACYQGLTGTPRAYAKRACNAASKKDRQATRNWLVKLAWYVSRNSNDARTQIFAECVVSELTC